MKRIIRWSARKLAAAVRESSGPPHERWASALGGNFSIGERTSVRHASFNVRETGCRVEIGKECDIRSHFALERGGAAIEIGSRTHTGGNTTFSLASRLVIGDDVLISFEVLVFDHGGHSLDWNHRRKDAVDWLNNRKDWTHVPVAPIVIKNKAWIGARAILLKGVTIGEGAVVGAGSVVTKDVPDWTVVAGNPARVLRTMPAEGRM